MKLNLRPTPGWAVVLLSVVALTLAGCGRKGPLDLPPTASGPTASAVPETEAEASNRTVFSPSSVTDASPTAAKGQKRPFVLDPLLGDEYKSR